MTIVRGGRAQVHFVQKQVSKQVIGGESYLYSVHEIIIHVYMLNYYTTSLFLRPISLIQFSSRSLVTAKSSLVSSSPPFSMLCATLLRDWNKYT